MSEDERTDQELGGQGTEGEGDDVQGKGPDGEEFDQERALETIRKQRESERGLERELKAARAQLQKLEAAEKKRQQAEMSEVERLQVERDDLAAQLRALEAERETLILRSAVEREATALGFHDPVDAYHLADLAGVTIDDGEVSGVDKALKALAKARPYLIRTVEKPEVNAGAKGQGGKQAPDVEAVRRRFGL